MPIRLTAEGMRTFEVSSGHFELLIPAAMIGPKGEATFIARLELSPMPEEKGSYWLVARSVSDSSDLLTCYVDAQKRSGVASTHYGLVTHDLSKWINQAVKLLVDLGVVVEEPLEANLAVGCACDATVHCYGPLEVDEAALRSLQHKCSDVAPDDTTRRFPY